MTKAHPQAELFALQLQPDCEREAKPVFVFVQRRKRGRRHRRRRQSDEEFRRRKRFTRSL
jgi:hypothetical protein